MAKMPRQFLNDHEAGRKSDLVRATQVLGELLMTKGKLTGSTSYLQRKMQIGYNAAAAIMTDLEESGVISEPDAIGERRFLRRQPPPPHSKEGEG